MSSNLQNEIGSLSAAEKAELIDALWESLEADVPALTDEQRAELDYRVARYQNNPSDVIPWEQVKAGLFKKVTLPVVWLAEADAELKEAR